MNKQLIREKILEMRRSLTSKYIEDASEAVFGLVTEIDVVKNARKILMYSNFDNEVKTAKLTGWLLYQGKDVYLPMIVNKKMYAASIRSAVLELSNFGVAQPRPVKAKQIHPKELDLIIVPGIAFDKQRNRLGFGFGYYDTFLEQAEQAEKIALAYDFQIVRKIPMENHDIRMDRIVTPDMVME